jgi:thymidylate kinase
VIIELVGASGAGKSTIARLLCERLGGTGSAVVASDIVLDRPLVRRIDNAQFANLVQDVRGLPYLARSLPDHAEVLGLSAAMLHAHAPSRFDLVMNARSVMRRIGMFELARARSGGRTVLVDEGPLLIAYHLFVYSNADLATAPLERFARSVPLPDLVVYVRSPLPVLVDRAFSRADGRRQLAGLTRPEAEAPLRRAVQVFDRLLSTPGLQLRTMVVGNVAQGPRELDDLVSHLAETVRSRGSATPSDPASVRTAIR